VISLTIDGKKIQVDEGATIIDAAKQLGIEIPSLCYDPVMEPYAACRICSVELVTPMGPKMVTACNTAAQDGMVVQTTSDGALSARRINLQLLMAQAPGAEIIRELAAEMGVEDTPFPISKLDEKCILCGLCVRACETITGTHAITFANRGVERVVTTPFDSQSEVCIACGACAYFCPTGAITMDDIQGREVIHDEMTLGPPKAIHIPFMQAIPCVPVIDTEACIHFQTGNCGTCEKVCQPGAIDYEQNPGYVDIDAGAIIYATGFKAFDPTPLESYGFGKYPEVYTSLQEVVIHVADVGRFHSADCSPRRQGR